MKILGVSLGTKNGNNDTMCRVALEEAQKMGAEIEFIHLFDWDIQTCSGCVACSRGLVTGKGMVCTRKDDFAALYEKMVEACEYLTGTLVGEKVAVIGGGLTGCEIAYELALQGKQPVIVEMKNDLIAQTGVCLANSSYLREWFAWKKVPVYLETTLQEVKDDSIVCKDASGKEITIPCDSVISSAGYIPNPLAPKGSNVSLVGDCDSVGNLRSVVWRAYEVAMKI